jgi:RNA polymerase sigma factor (sigma-70 family)
MSSDRASAGTDTPGALTTLHVRQAIAGDAHSLGWLVERLTPLLEAHARYRLGNLSARCDPLDVVHDAWLVALPRLPELTARDGRLTPVLLRFLSTTVMNRVRSLLYDRVRRGEVATPSELAAEHSGAVTHAMRAERAAAVRAAIDDLDDADRQIVLLRGVEQVSANVAAVVLGLSVDAVNKRFQRAMARLRERLPGSVFEEIET